MAETIKCVCNHCGAKYRLPIEAQGRSAKCKRCGEKFRIPQNQSLEDSILTWLGPPGGDDDDDVAPAKPKVINMPVSENPNEDSVAGQRHRTIRLREDGQKESKGGKA